MCFSTPYNRRFEAKVIMTRPNSELEIRVRGWVSFYKTLFFALLCLIAFLLLYIQQSMIIAEIAAFQFLEGPQVLIFQLISGFKLLTIPIVYALKFTIVGFILWVGCFMGDIKSLTQCWQIAMMLSWFFVPTFLKILWFLCEHHQITGNINLFTH